MRAYVAFLALVLVVIPIHAQIPPQIPRPGPAPPTPPPGVRPRAVRPPNIPPPGFWNIEAADQQLDGPWRRARGHAVLQSTDMLFRADEIDYNTETGELNARGHVFFQNFERNEEVSCDRLEYNTEEQKGIFYNVSGSTNPRIDARPGVLTSTSPFHFEGKWAERIGEKYILHDGMITNCKVPRPWWTLRGPVFDIIPGERAIARRTIFRVRRFPIFYTPYFYKSLEKIPRRSGFLLPNIGNSSTKGKMFGVSYFWAINRSYDATYRVLDYTERGFAHHLDLRGKPRAGTDFDFILYGVQDRGLKLDNGEVLKQGGLSIYAAGKSDLGHGFQAIGVINYLTSLTFRQAFSESFNEAIFSEVHSIGFVARHWSYYNFNAVFARIENFQSAERGNSIVIRKLPEFEFSSRDRQVTRDLPFWFSLESSAGLLRRNQPLFQTRQFTERLDFYPRLMTALRLGGFHLIPSFGIRETHYGEHQEDRRIAGDNLNRSAREFGLDIVAPSIERIFNRKTFLGDKVKHVIEPRLSYRYVSGISDFNEIIRFDETDLLSNTNELEISLTNRLYSKRGNQVSEVLSWQLWQKRYFDPTFGDAVIPGRRNVVWSSADLTGYAFLDRPRSASPIVSVLRANPISRLGLEWRADYDPMRGGIVNSGFTADMRRSKYFISAGHNQVRSVSLLSPSANQFRGLVGYGNENRRGWNFGFTAIYDYRLAVLQYATTQVTYNTDCCGFNIQYRRFNFGTRNENQFRVAFAVANIGSFGTLKKQERLF